MIQFKKLTMIGGFVAFSLALLFGYSNCGKAVTFQNTDSSYGLQSFSSSITVGQVENNPPLDLFFVVDNSASMGQHQIDLGQAFANIFESNSSALAKFDVNVYLFSTASTMNTNFLSQIPITSPSMVPSLPAANDFSNLVRVPGNIYGIWNSANGNYGTAPFSAQFYPAPVLGLDSSNSVAPSLFLAKKGSQSASSYTASIRALTASFQNRLAYLNPSNQIGDTTVSKSTDVSSALCTMARIAKHAKNLNFIRPGDSSAFIVVSDDNDRLNDRNPSNNQCADSIIGNDQLVDGTCAHYSSTFKYNSSSSINYKKDSKFTYKSGTNIAYSYPSTASCSIQYQNGYSYAWTYTALNTNVQYTKCTQYADGFCVKTAVTTQKIAGNRMNPNGSCISTISSLVSSAAPNSTFACSSANVANQIGAPGVDANSNGSSCSSQLVATLSSNSTKQFTNCQIGSVSNTTKSITGQPLNSCNNYCANNPQYAGCSLVSAAVVRTNGSLKVNTVGLNCSSQCPANASAVCGNGTISNYLTATHGSGATCGTASDTLSTLIVNSGANSNGSALSCTGNLGSFSIKDSSNQAVCAGSSTVEACIQSLQSGSGSSCAIATGTTTALTAPLDVNCATSCANSKGFCDPNQYSTVAQFIAQNNNGMCVNATVGGAKSLSLAFTPAVAASVSCSTNCADTLNGSCDGLGFGASDGSTVGDYIEAIGGGKTCTVTTTQVAGSTVVHAPASSTGSVCTEPNTFFKATSSPYANTQINYVAGSVTHTSNDLINYIKSSLGNNSSVAVIGHLASDSNLAGTNVSTDYLNLAAAMGSNQVSSISGNYAEALSDISDFIVRNTQNSFSLAVNADSQVYSVSIQRQNTTAWQKVSSSLWSWSGQTLTMNPSVGLQVGDQIMYEYH